MPTQLMTASASVMAAVTDRSLRTLQVTGSTWPTAPMARTNPASFGRRTATRTRQPSAAMIRAICRPRNPDPPKMVTSFDMGKPLALPRCVLALLIAKPRAVSKRGAPVAAGRARPGVARAGSRGPPHGARFFCDELSVTIAADPR